MSAERAFRKGYTPQKFEQLFTVLEMFEQVSDKRLHQTPFCRGVRVADIPKDETIIKMIVGAQNGIVNELKQAGVSDKYIRHAIRTYRPKTVKDF